MTKMPCMVPCSRVPPPCSRPMPAARRGDKRFQSSMCWQERRGLPVRQSGEQSRAREEAGMNESYGDIRQTSGAEHWKHFEKAWQALITYTHLGKTTPGLDLGATEVQMPLRHDMRNAAGGIMAAPLCIIAPEADWSDEECVPAPLIMTYEVLDPAVDVKRLAVVRDPI